MKLPSLCVCEIVKPPPYTIFRHGGFTENAKPALQIFLTLFRSSEVLELVSILSNKLLIAMTHRSNTNNKTIEIALE